MKHWVVSTFMIDEPNYCPGWHFSLFIVEIKRKDCTSRLPVFKSCVQVNS